MQTFTVYLPLLRHPRGHPAWPLRYEPRSAAVKRPAASRIAPPSTLTPLRLSRAIAVGRGLVPCRPAVAPVATGMIGMRGGSVPHSWASALAALDDGRRGTSPRPTHSRAGLPSWRDATPGQACYNRVPTAWRCGMLTREDNELLTRTGPGTPMGALLRRYWLPALLSEELPEPDGRPVRMPLLGERLVAYRDSTGQVGLLEEACPHRGASLALGRNEDGALRCIY